jgi:hypothetical protein
MHASFLAGWARVLDHESEYLNSGRASESIPQKGAIGMSPRAGDLKVLIVLAEG